MITAMCILLALTIVSFLLLSHHNIELFQSAQSEVIVYTTNQLNYFNWIDQIGKRSWKVQNLTIDAIDTLYKDVARNKRFPSVIVPSVNSIVWLASELQFEQYLKPIGKQNKLSSQDAHFVAIGIPEVMYYFDCSFDMRHKTIGYFDEVDRHFIMCIIHAYRIPASNVKMQQVPLAEWDELNAYMTRAKVDVIVAHIVPESPLNVLIRTQYVSVMGWGNLDMNRISVFNPFLKKQEINMQAMFMTGDLKNNALVMDREKRGPVVTVNIGMYALNNIVMPPSVDTFEPFITRLGVTPDVYDPSYRCYGDLSIEQKALCVSPYNQQGDTKRVATKWDRPCIEDKDCPFFGANKNYKNNRGGCLEGGICEMPTGVYRTAYRLYDDSGVYSPFCYQCTDPSDKLCCAKQMNPDYAFADDTEDRNKAKLPTYVPLML